MVALIDYGAGNLASVRKALSAVGAAAETPSSVRDLDRARGLIIPGVGHFAATAALSREWRAAIVRRIEAGVPLLGICLGMQWLFEGSTEAPDVAGLGLFSGICTRIEAVRPLRVPHVGWNTLATLRPSALLAGVPAGAHVYFTHSFAAPATDDSIAATTHGQTFAAAIERDHIYAVQFHPEKSAEPGLQILRNFVRLAGG